MSVGRDITVSELREMMIDALRTDAWTDEQIAGYLTAHENVGFLRDKAPAWVRNSAALTYLIPEGLKTRDTTAAFQSAPPREGAIAQGWRPCEIKARKHYSANLGAECPKRSRLGFIWLSKS